MFSLPSHYLIVISSKSLEDTEDIEDMELLPVGQDNDHPYYVTASVTYNRSLPLFTIGSGSDTIDPVTGRHFNNAPLHKEQTYYYFIRAYSAGHTSEVRSIAWYNKYTLIFIQYPFFGTSKISTPIGKHWNTKDM